MSAPGSVRRCGRALTWGLAVAAACATGDGTVRRMRTERARREQTESEVLSDRRGALLSEQDARARMARARAADASAAVTEAFRRCLGPGWVVSAGPQGEGTATAPEWAPVDLSLGSPELARWPDLVRAVASAEAMGIGIGRLEVRGRADGPGPARFESIHISLVSRRT